MSDFKPLVDTRVCQKKQKSYPHVATSALRRTVITFDQLLSVVSRFEATIIQYNVLFSRPEISGDVPK